MKRGPRPRTEIPPTKVCGACRIEKPMSGFNSRNRWKGGYAAFRPGHVCRMCARAQRIAQRGKTSARVRFCLTPPTDSTANVSWWTSPAESREAFNARVSGEVARMQQSRWHRFLLLEQL